MKKIIVEITVNDKVKNERLISSMKSQGYRAKELTLPSEELSRKNGWVIMNDYLVCYWTFANTRKESIEIFMNSLSGSWRWWKRNYKYRCVKCIQKLTLKGGE